MRFKPLLFFITFLLFLCPQAKAQSTKTFAVLPFEVHGPQEYQYLSQGIQSMLSSRLTRAGQTSSIPPGEVNRRVTQLPESTDQARDIRSELGADFLVYGTVTVMDRETSLDVYTIAADRSFDPVLKQPSLAALIPSLEQVAADLLTQAVPGSAPAPETEQVIQQEVTAAQAPTGADVFVSPHFRFEDDPYAAGRWRSQTLSFASVGIALGKSAQDNGQTIFILGDRAVHAYRLDQGRMLPVATYEAPLTYQCLNINTYDLNRDGNDEIIVSAVQDERARTFILSFEDNQFKTLYERIPFFMNVVNLPPNYRPALVGQRLATGTRLFNPGSVQEVMMTSQGPELGPGLSLPPNANIFNFAYLPEGDSHLVVIAENDVLKVYSAGHNLRYTTSDEYAGSGLGLEVYGTMPGLARGSDHDPDYYYIPTRLLPYRFAGGTRYHLLAHKHHAGLSRIFARYRNFPEGEIRALFWDDIGLNVHWNTRKIRASIVDFGIYDFDGDGQKELVVLLNTHPGITGLQDKSTIVLAYKMDQAGMGGTN
ncbi:VCBS repeat-containing protein [Desulfonatronovibrio hydrogenovorans]|uniref:VCBS repeat-containing protein n=1 Tax=Desulfonatronovibrio hydrogenovorans TaxID=53245 RepID=UPI00123714AC|nr:VCBS repeat-containing protein [Desulfonatronovibrio hydrogenovorans]